MNIPIKNNLKRVVIIGAGFAGLQVAKKLRRDKFQVVLIDKNNYHTFQPLLYQVATSGLEPDSIIHTIRTIIKKTKNFFFRLANVHFINIKEKKIHTNVGILFYDYLIIATGSITNYFGNKNIEFFSLPMKSIPEALNIRSLILQNFEYALLTKNSKEREKLITFVIVGGGPTGVELAGSLAEMKKYILQNDYPDLNIQHMNIHLLQASSRLLDGMSEKSSKQAFKNLKELGVNIWLNCLVKDYDSEIIFMDKNRKIESANVIWAAGVKGAIIKGFIKEDIMSGQRILVDNYLKTLKYPNIFAIGDVAYIIKNKYYPNGHPMTAQPAIQQGKWLAKNFNYFLLNNKIGPPFKYKNLGNMATIGRNKAVCDFTYFKLKGFLAWIIWMFVHLISLVGFRNKIIVLTNWIIQYFHYNKSIRIIIKKIL
ncbi:NAD(P)/FAD-dependent oxidoreductase [Blattabacterium sp. (Cryptocercus punctulatus) str. Cpu]|uniref:NAD(P)/FAD-dependent oxidoreductase n=1 Tax=Blattabacterium sp. (Cryptocercus punctulatus) str. Cpu TaxID=1075399 RepID=UPI000238729C|nr:NAD(P)/FAD-dependent oxidoreductase [Blattabacterium sp. (Cryptocercus punctulatus) str. Cpu]AEU09239.1 NADH dehydrogenase (quinone) [Blattabacterium sp. (Cryptocercus punctulatus) str. Cpu]